LADVVDSFQIFHTGQGAQGILGKPSKQQLDTVFGTHNDVEVLTIVLEKGVAQSAEGIHYGGTTNATRGSAVVNTRGKGSTGI